MRVTVLLDEKRMRAALADLDTQLDRDVQLVIGGGGAMVLAYRHPLATNDVDAFTRRGSATLAEIDVFAKRTAKKLDLAPDWLNQHFETFTHVLPADFATRLRPVFAGKRLTADALGPEDMLVMKCFAGRDKDRPHAKRLLREVKDFGVVDRQLALLADKRVLHAQRAADWLDDLRDELGL